MQGLYPKESTDGCPALVEGGISAESTSVTSSDDDRGALIFALMTLLGILIGEEVGFLMDWRVLCAVSA